MGTLGDKIMPKLCSKYSCKNCDYFTDKKSSYENHLNSNKHKMVTNGLQMGQNYAKIMPTSFICSCGKQYQHRQGLWRHKKKCANQSCKKDLDNEEKQQQIIEFLLKENSEFKNLLVTTFQEQNKNIVELAKNAGNNNSHNTNNNNTTNNNTTNNSFNLQFYLNDTCKNAMNIMDFVSQLQVGINDLEETGRLGFAEGISKIFINGLKQISVNDRPLHCSDLKRETLYVKNNNEWTKENDDKTILTNAIKHVAYKNMKQISEWTKDNPEYNDPDSKVSDKYQQIVSESMSGSTKEETNKNYNKIIKNIVKETVIDK